MDLDLREDGRRWPESPMNTNAIAFFHTPRLGAFSVQNLVARVPTLNIGYRSFDDFTACIVFVQPGVIGET